MSEAITAVAMPKWGMSMTQGLLVAWLVDEGAAVAPGDELLEIETDKITNVLEAPAGGILRRRVVAAGETVPVGALLGLLAAAEVPEDALDAFTAGYEAPALVNDEGAGGPEPAFVEAGGARQRYLLLGDEATGTPMVLIHGFGGDLDNWLFNQPALAAERPVYAIDLLGHGGSEKAVASGDLAELGAALAAAIAALGLSRPHLAGHSLGGAVALWLAAEGGLAPASLSLIAPVAVGGPVEAGYVADFMTISRARKLKPVLARLFGDAGLVSAEMVEAVVRAKRIDGAAEALARIAAACLGADQTGRLAPSLSGLEVPCQVIWGGRDQIIPADAMAALPDAIVHHLLPEAGHMAHMERAAEVNALLAAFARAHDSDG